MIQRKQTIWLLLAVVLNVFAVFTDIYRWTEKTASGDVQHELKVNNHYPSLILLIAAISLPSVAIFMFANRKKQLGVTAMAMVACMSAISMNLARVSSTTKDIAAAANGTYWIGAILPLVAVVFLVLAIIGIKSDDKLVKSMDRLR